VKKLFIGRELQWARQEPESDKNGTNEILFQLLSLSRSTRSSIARNHHLAGRRFRKTVKKNAAARGHHARSTPCSKQAV